MKLISELYLGSSDAENYKRKENKSFFNKIFVRNHYLEKLLNPCTYFLIGEKGTGKTAYSVFLSNNEYKNTISQIRYLRETDYQKFIVLKKQKHLQLSDYSSIWIVIIYLLIAANLKSEEIDSMPFNRGAKMRKVLDAIHNYYEHAFSPEIITALDFIENDKIAAEIVGGGGRISAESSQKTAHTENRFQINLLYIRNKFEEAFRSLKLKQNRLLFIDGIDIRPGSIPYNDYLECVKGLANAIWSINSDFFSNIKDSPGHMRAICLLRPDIYNSINLQNATNKVRDNAVFLDWKTTYADYRDSGLFVMIDRLLSYNQDEKLELGKTWDYYLPFQFESKSSIRESDDSFIECLRLTYSRPRDFVAMLQILQSLAMNKNMQKKSFTKEDFLSSEFQNMYSEYLIGTIKDQLSFYYSDRDFELFIHFFSYLNGRIDFEYHEYERYYKEYENYIYDNLPSDIPEFIENKNKFLQFLYDTNIICYIEDTYSEPLFRWCYRERSISNISPKVKIGVRYRIHYGLAKALNVGNLTHKNTFTKFSA